jgi:hypothetical protein
VSGQVLQVAWYRFTATFGRRWGGYLSIVLLIGLTGGTAMGSIAAARRTQSSFATFLASTNPSDMNLANVSAPVLTNDLERLPGVQQARSALYINAFPLARTGAAIIPPSYVDDEVTALGSLDGEYFDQDRVTVTRGRSSPPPRRRNCSAGTSGKSSPLAFTPALRPTSQASAQRK